MLNMYERASKALLLSNADTLPIDMSKLKIEGLCWKALTRKDAKHRGIIENEEFVSYADKHTGFVLDLLNGKYLIIVDECLPMTERNYIIAHEIGHIICCHTSLHGVLGKSNDYKTEHFQEREADICALLLLAPPCVLDDYGISEYEDIMKFTGVSEDHAKQIVGELQRYRRTKKTATEKALCKKFRAKKKRKGKGAHLPDANDCESD